MIRDWKAWEEFEQRLIASEPVDYRRNLRLVDAMYDLARKLGAFDFADPLAGIDTKIRVAKALRHVRITP